MEKEVTCCFEIIKPKRKEEWRLIELANKASFEIKIKQYESEKPILIAKEDLAKHKWMIVEIRREEPEPYYLDEEPTGNRSVWWAALVDVSVDEDSGELVGTRILETIGKRWIERFRFNLERYGTWWRAWEVIPDYSERPPWGDGIKD